MKVSRIFKGPDIEMLGTVRDLVTHFESKLAQFTAFDPSLDAAYLANWQTIQDQAWATIPDNLEIIEGEILMEDVISALEKCRLKNTEVKYYAGKAFPANTEARKEFGEGQFTKVRNSPLRMVQYMQTLHGVATKYKTELIAQNYTQAAIDEIAALAQELRDDNNLQQLKKKERPTETRKRIELMNAYYRMGQPVVLVAQHIFRTSPAARKLFRLTAPVPSTAEKRIWFVLEMEGTRRIALPKLLKKNKVTLTNQSAEHIEYWFADTISETPTGKETFAAGETLTLTLPQPVKKFLVVQNTSDKKVRLMQTKKLK